MPPVAAEMVLTAERTGTLGMVTELMGEHYEEEGESRLRELATMLEPMIIVTMGIIFCIFHPLNGNTARPITPTEWAVITVGIGVVGGALFHLFLGGETNQDRLFISLAGAIILASGAAAYLHLSPVLTSMIVGAVLLRATDIRWRIVAAEREQLVVGGRAAVPGSARGGKDRQRTIGGAHQRRDPRTW